jgi:hypothetical protein
MTVIKTRKPARIDEERCMRAKPITPLNEIFPLTVNLASNEQSSAVCSGLENCPSRRLAPTVRGNPRIKSGIQTPFLPTAAIAAVGHCAQRLAAATDDRLAITLFVLQCVDGLRHAVKQSGPRNRSTSSLGAGATHERVRVECIPRAS